VTSLAPTLAWIGALTSCCLAMPQAVKAYRSTAADLAGVSIAGQLVLSANALIWIGWGVTTQQYVVGCVPSGFSLPLSLFTASKVLRSRPKLAAVQPATPTTRCGRYIAPAGERCVLSSRHASACSTLG
jgi:hypothetical protein